MNSWLGGWLYRVGRSFQADKDITVLGELKGARILLGMGRISAISNDSPLKTFDGVSFGTDEGYVMPRAGSIVGVSGNINVTVQTQAGNIEFDVQKNNEGVYSGATITIDSLGKYKGWSTQARGLTNFVAGDRIRCKLDFLTFAGTITNVIGLIEIQFDT